MASTRCASDTDSSARSTVGGVPDRASGGTAKLASCDGCPGTGLAVGTAEVGLASGPGSPIPALGTPDRACSAGGLPADSTAAWVQPVGWAGGVGGSPEHLKQSEYSPVCYTLGALNFQHSAVRPSER